MRELAPGENAGLSGTPTLSAEPPAATLILSVAADGTAVGAPDPAAAHGHSALVEVRPTDLPVDLDAVPAAVDRLLVVVHGPEAARRYVVVAGADHYAVPITRSSGLPVRVVLEFYRRGTDWKIRAVDEGYAGGLAELGRHHGLTLPPSGPATGSAAPIPAAQTVAQTVAQAVAQPAVPAGDRLWETERLLRRVSGLWEDAARSAAAYRDATAFAENRRDREIEDLLSDQTTRGADHPARLEAERRARELVEAAATRRFEDLDGLTEELTDIEAGLPAPTARWDHPAWRQPLPELGIGVIRVGELSGPEGEGPPLPLLRYIGTGGTVLIVSEGFIPAARALLLRILAARDRGGALDVVTPDPAIASALNRSPTPGPDERADRLERVVLGLDLLDMQRRADADADAGAGAAAGAAPPVADAVPGVLVVDATVLAPDERELDALHRIARLGPPAGLTLVLLAPRSGLDDWAYGLDPLVLPTEPVEVVDSWTQQTWRLAPDGRGGGEPDPVLAGALVRRCAG